MSPYTNFHAPRTSLSGRIQIGQKSGYLFIFIYYYLFSVNIKPPRHRFGFSLARDWQFWWLGLWRLHSQYVLIISSSCFTEVNIYEIRLDSIKIGKLFPIEKQGILWNIHPLLFVLVKYWFPNSYPYNLDKLSSSTAISVLKRNSLFILTSGSTWGLFSNSSAWLSVWLFEL